MNNWINTAASDIARARTVGLVQLTPDPFPILVVGTKPAQSWFFAARGTIETWSGATDYALRTTVGDSLGEIDPDVGTFSVTVGSGSAITVRADQDAAGLQKQLNDDATITTNGGVDVVEQGFGRFLIAYRALGVVSAITASAALAFPDASATLNVLATGSATVRQLVMLTLRRILAAQSSAWTVTSTPSAGWTGTIDLTSAAAKEMIRLKGKRVGAFLECETVLTVEVIDASGNAACPYQTPVILRALNYDAAITLMDTGPTRNAQANSSGDVSVVPTSQIHTERITVTGSAGTRNIVITSPTGIVAGARIDLVFILDGAANATRLKIYALSTSGTLLFDFTRNGDEPNAEFIVYANGSGGFDRKEQVIPAFPA